MAVVVVFGFGVVVVPLTRMLTVPFGKTLMISPLGPTAAIGALYGVVVGVVGGGAGVVLVVGGQIVS